MINIDGSHGEGGGQILRSSLSLAIATGKPCRITKIRAGRQKPGLMRQHLTALKAAIEICGGDADGMSIGSREVVFNPGKVVPGRYSFAVGTAGSATLVLQTILPALMVAEAPSELMLEGGTHNPWSPPFDFLRTTFLPLLEKMGVTVTARLESHGFFPAGGGRFSLSVSPSGKLEALSLCDRPDGHELSGTAIVSALPESIARRELVVLGTELGIPGKDLKIVEIEDGHGPGNVVMIEVRSDEVTELFTGFGRRKVRAENVAGELVKEVSSYLKARVPVGPHLADQLLLPMALAGRGEFLTQKPTLHTQTNIEVIREFMDMDIKVSQEDNDAWSIRING
jgi:RNA 3'-terminal phosphate cyclase (ATP)